MLTAINHIDDWVNVAQRFPFKSISSYRSLSRSVSYQGNKRLSFHQPQEKSVISSSRTCFNGVSLHPFFCVIILNLAIFTISIFFLKKKSIIWQIFNRGVRKKSMQAALISTIWRLELTTELVRMADRFQMPLLYPAAHSSSMSSRRLCCPLAASPRSRWRFTSWSQTCCAGSFTDWPVHLIPHCPGTWLTSAFPKHRPCCCWHSVVERRRPRSWATSWWFWAWHH